MNDQYAIRIDSASSSYTLSMDLEVSDSSKPGIFACKPSLPYMSGTPGKGEVFEISVQFPEVRRDLIEFEVLDGESISDAIRRVYMEMTSEYNYTITVFLKADANMEQS